jgi:cell division septation protein DedD
VAYSLIFPDVPHDYMQLYYALIGGYASSGKANSYAMTTTWENEMVFTLGGRFEVENHAVLPTPLPSPAANYSVAFMFLSNVTVTYVDVGVLPAFNERDGFLFSVSVVESLGLPATLVDVISERQMVDNSATWSFMTAHTLQSDSPISSGDVNAAFTSLVSDLLYAAGSDGTLLNDLHVNAMRESSLALSAVASLSVTCSSTYSIMTMSTATPTTSPTGQPTTIPSVSPKPTAVPTVSPTKKPTAAPTVSPTKKADSCTHCIANQAADSCAYRCTYRTADSSAHSFPYRATDSSSYGFT